MRMASAPRGVTRIPGALAARQLVGRFQIELTLAAFRADSALLKNWPRLVDEWITRSMGSQIAAVCDKRDTRQLAAVASASTGGLDRGDRRSSDIGLTRGRMPGELLHEGWLEAEVGVQLFVRTTHSVQVTEAPADAFGSHSSYWNIWTAESDR